MTKRALVALFMGLVLSACASVTPPPRLSMHDPADPAGVEPPPPASSELLKADASEDAGAPAKDEMPMDMDMPGMEHQHAEPGAAAPDAAAAVYTCPMHPSVHETRPGKCPICGMTLVKKEPQKPQGSGSK